MSNHQPIAALQACALSLGYSQRQVIEGLDLAIPHACITVLVGSNGCGKSTLLRALARLIAPRRGSVLLDGADIHRLPTTAVAKRLSILPQSPLAPDGISVHQLVRLGRYPHQTWRQQWSRQDEAQVDLALRRTGLHALRDRVVDTLSGGQRQRAWIAMVLAQGADTLLLDEPTTYLDLAHQIDVLDLLAELHAQERKTIVMVLHDLNLASRYADHMVMLREGRIHAQGRPRDVLTVSAVKAVFDLDSRIVTDPVAGTPLCVPISRARRAGPG